MLVLLGPSFEGTGEQYAQLHFDALGAGGDNFSAIRMMGFGQREGYRNRGRGRVRLWTRHRLAIKRPMSTRG